MNTHDFRVGRVLGPGLRVMLQSLLPFLLLAALAYLPAGISLAYMPQPPPPDPAAGIWGELSACSPLRRTDSEWRSEQFVTLAISACFGLYLAVCASVPYHDLRVVKEGASTPDLLTVFE